MTDGAAMPSYEIVKKPDSPKRGRWRSIFDPLEYGKAVRFECATLSEVFMLRARIASVMRGKGLDYRLVSRTEYEDDKIVLYFWKVLKEAK